MVIGILCDAITAQFTQDSVRMSFTALRLVKLESWLNRLEV